MQGDGVALVKSLMQHDPKRRLLRIRQEISGLMTNLPVHYGSSIFVRVDEDQPDVMKVSVLLVLLLVLLLRCRCHPVRQVLMIPSARSTSPDDAGRRW